MKLQLFRYILTPTQFKIGELSKSTTKREIMLNLLNSSFDFRLRAIEFLYRPITKAGEDIIVADIGKKIYKAHDKRIEDRFVKRKEEEWPHRKIIINTNERIQLVAFEIHRPESLMALCMS
jgi:hypothetical protein